MATSTFADRLNTCLDAEGFPPKNRGRIQQLAEMVGLTHRGASKWINGESTPPAKKYAPLAQKFNVSERWLRTGEGSMREGENSSVVNMENIFSQDVNIYDPHTLLTEEKNILQIVKCNLAEQGHYFGIVLNTEAMSPRFPSGTVIIFDDAVAKDGDFVLVNYDGLPSPIFRQLLVIGSSLYLNAHNPKFDRIILSEPKRILGRLVQAILSFT